MLAAAGCISRFNLWYSDTTNSLSAVRYGYIWLFVLFILSRSGSAENDDRWRDLQFPLAFSFFSFFFPWRHEYPLRYFCLPRFEEGVDWVQAGYTFRLFMRMLVLQKSWEEKHPIGWLSIEMVEGWWEILHGKSTDGIVIKRNKALLHYFQHQSIPLLIWKQFAFQPN